MASVPYADPEAFSDYRRCCGVDQEFVLGDIQKGVFRVIPITKILFLALLPGQESAAWLGDTGNLAIFIFLACGVLRKGSNRSF